MGNVAYRPVNFKKGRAHRVRTGTAQATVGQTDWIAVPAWATYMRLVYDLTSIGASTTPSALMTLLTPSNPANAHLSESAVLPGTDIPSTDTVVLHVGGTTLSTAFTAAGTADIAIGPGLVTTPDFVLGASGVVYARICDVLPSIIGIKILQDRGDGDEVYTYTVDVEFR
jgi:hypothetical protein